MRIDSRFTILQSDFCDKQETSITGTSDTNDTVTTDKSYYVKVSGSANTMCLLEVTQWSMESCETGMSCELVSRVAERTTPAKDGV